MDAMAGHHEGSHYNCDKPVMIYAAWCQFTITASSQNVHNVLKFVGSLPDPRMWQVHHGVNLCCILF